MAATNRPGEFDIFFLIIKQEVNFGKFHLNRYNR